MSCLENRHDKVFVFVQFRGAVSGRRRLFGTPDGSFLGKLEAVLGHAEAVRVPPLHEKMHTSVCTVLLSFRPPLPGRKFFETSGFRV